MCETNKKAENLLEKETVELTDTSLENVSGGFYDRESEAEKGGIVFDGYNEGTSIM